jgi:hypothetical protein
MNGRIYATQMLHNAAVHALALHPAAKRKSAQRALVTVSVHGAGTKAVLMRKTDGVWELEDIYTADHYTPGTVGVFVLGVW